MGMANIKIMLRSTRARETCARMMILSCCTALGAIPNYLGLGSVGFWIIF
jgi:hypothetical protein